MAANPQGKPRYRIRSGKELVQSPVPEIDYRILGVLRANGGRMSLTGLYKSEKSLLAQELAMRIAKGDDWLGFKTIRGNVLYINLEISEEKFHERTQDFHAALGYDANNLSQFRTITILDKNLDLDRGPAILQEILDECKTDSFIVDVLFLDPRADAIAQSENEEVVIKSFCHNIDSILDRNPGLSVVIVTHMGKDPTKGAIGHSRYSGWLDTEITIVKNPKLSCNKQLLIKGRDTEEMEVSLDFSYPIHNVVQIEATARKTKVDAAKDFLLTRLSDGDIAVQQLRQEARRQGITDYAFSTAVKELKDEDKIDAVQAPGQGNRKLLKLIAPSTPP